MKNKHTLILTDLELLALMDSLDDLSAMSDNTEISKQVRKNLNKIDKMFKKNGYKRQYT